MLLNVASDRQFQRYLDIMEQRLHVAMAPILAASARIQVNRSGVQAENYTIERGEPLLVRHLQRIYRDQYRSVSAAVEEHELKADTVTDFMTEQLRHITQHGSKEIRRIAENLRADINAKILAMTQ